MLRVDHRLLDDFGERSTCSTRCNLRLGMDAQTKTRYGGKLVFWGGGVDTQHTLPFGTPQQVRSEVGERLRVFSPGGGFVFNTVHNVLAHTPVDNLLAMFAELLEFNQGGKKI
jgi:uroporphyrinogen-III decarboxylase